MHFFTDYIQPLTLWLSYHPHWALLITFLISFSESLAIIGSIIPGSVTMTAIGILAGSGVMRIDFTLLAATLGAIAGDTGSYTLGYIFSDRLINIWPFNRYPTWLAYGKLYFEKHGSSSVLIGRFVGPMRSIIPVIAGMMQMNQWHFLLANILSGIAWAMLYVLPGVLIGAAGSLLSTESTTHLFALILMFLVIVWLLGLGLKWLLLLINQFLNANLHQMWLHLKKHPLFRTSARYLAPKHEIYHYNTAALTCLWLFSFIMSIIMTAFILQSFLANAINNPVYLFLQSLRTQSFDVFFIFMRFFIHPFPLLVFALSVSLYAMYSRDWRMLRYWICLCFTCSLLTWALTSFINTPVPSAQLHFSFTPSLLAANLTLATAIFSFLILYIQAYHRTIVMQIFCSGLNVILFLSGLALLYLGDNWATSILAAYLVGVTFSLSHWILFRRNTTVTSAGACVQIWIISTGVILLLATAITSIRYFKQAVLDHAPYQQQFILSHHAWWNQTEPVLPVFTTNRIGQRIGLFNIQYLGKLGVFERALTNQGWKKQNDSLFYPLLLRAGGKYSAKKLPLMTQLYINKKPELIMAYPLGQGQAVYILRLWRSNYHLRHISQPIWLGSVLYLQGTSQTTRNHKENPTPFTRILQGLDGFEFQISPLPNKQMKGLPVTERLEILRIRESSEFNPKNHSLPIDRY